MSSSPPIRKERAIIHIDMDAFYASVEERDQPRLKGLPVVVGGPHRRGVVCAASYAARRFGVRSAMPMATALRLCPKAVVIEPRFPAYVDASQRVFAILERFTPLIEPLSLDEAFLDVTGSRALFGPPDKIAADMRRLIAQEVDLPASAGIATVKFVAKIASDFAKPNGQKQVTTAETIDFLSPLPIGRLWGVGKKTEQRLLNLALKTIGDVATVGREWMERELGPAGVELWLLSQGIDPRPVVPDREAKSIGAEDTFSDDLRDEAVLGPFIHAQALRVGRRLRHSGLKTRVVQLKIKFADFVLITRRLTLPQPTDDGDGIYRQALALFRQIDDHRAIRLTGVSAQDLTVPTGTLELFASGPKKSDKLNLALDKIADKFGCGSILPGDVVEADQPVRSRR